MNKRDKALNELTELSQKMGMYGMNIEQKADEIYRDLLKDPDEVLRLLKEGLEDYEGDLGEWICSYNTDYTPVTRAGIGFSLFRVVANQANTEAMREAQRLAELEYMGSDLDE